MYSWDKNCVQLYENLASKSPYFMIALYKTFKTEFLSCGSETLLVPRPPHCRSLEITLRNTTLGRTLLYERSVCCGELYLIKHNTHNRQTSMPTTGFDPRMSASKRPRTHTLVGPATGIGFKVNYQR